MGWEGPKDTGAAASLLRLFHHELGGTEAAAAHKHVNKQKSCRELLALGSDDLWRQARFHPKTCHSFTSTGGCDDPWFPSQKVRTQRAPAPSSGAVTYFSYVSVAPSL